jgi:hypothetical protein
MGFTGQRHVERREKVGLVADDIYLSTKPAKGTKTIPNPKGVTPKLDTDKPDLPKNRYVDMDTHNPPSSSLIPGGNRHSADPFEMHGIGFETPRHSSGHFVSPDHPAIQESEN